MPPVDDARQREQEGVGGVDETPRPQRQLDERELRGRADLDATEVRDKRRTPFREDLADRRVGRGQLRLRVEARPEIRDGTTALRDVGHTS